MEWHVLWFRQSATAGSAAAVSISKFRFFDAICAINYIFHTHTHTHKISQAHKQTHKCTNTLLCKQIQTHKHKYLQIAYRAYANLV